MPGTPEKNIQMTNFIHLKLVFVLNLNKGNVTRVTTY